MKTFYRYVICMLIVFFYASASQAALPKATWYKGKVTCWNKEVLEGEVSYNWSAEMVMLRQDDGRIQTFTSNQIYEFSWFDLSQNKRREFLALSHTLLDGLPKQTFFEVIMDGSLSVVRRLRRPHGLFKKAFSHPAYYNDQPILSQNHDQFDYFVYDAGRMAALDRFYSDIYTPLMANHAQELHRYIQERNLNDRSLLGRLVVIDHYNYLSQQDSKSASVKAAIANQNKYGY